MVKREEKERMAKFLTDRLEDAGIYRVVNARYPIVTVEEILSSPRSFVVVLHADKLMTGADYEALRVQTAREGRRIADVFYKDGKEFMVRLAGSAFFRQDKSLKRYHTEDIQKMVQLRLLEKEVVEKHGPVLVYFQPQTSQLEQSIKSFSMKPVVLDYSHLSYYDQAKSFAKDGYSASYRIAEPLEDRTITKDGRAIFAPGMLNSALLVPVKEKK